MNKSVVGILVVILIVAGILFYYGRGDNTAIANGHLYVAVTDAAADMSGISDVRLTVTGVELMGEAQTFNLLELKAGATLALVAQADIPAGTYNQVRLMVSKVEVVKSDGATAEAKLPSGELKIVGNIVVAEGANTNLTLDFLADKSLHMTGKGEFIFAPVVAMESRSNAEVAVDADRKVKVSGGKIDSNIKVGTDVDGSVRENFELDTTGGVTIDNGVIKLNVTKGAGTSTSATITNPSGTKTVPSSDAKTKSNTGATQ